ncbi:MAG: type II secretion system minor pseudopilin GspJ [Gammaproteobacteria bacterium]|jgi:general secretion pathway protein J
MRTRSTTRPAAGFTLLELLVALAIFSLIAVMSYNGLKVVLNTQAATEIQADALAEMQKVYLLMQRDIEQVVPRPVRDEYGDEQPALTGDDALQLTRGGWSNPAGRLRSSLQRVGYAFEDRQLVRYSWAVLDRAQDSEPQRQVLVGDVEEMTIRYLSANNEWQERWPNPLAVAEVNVPGAGLPRAVEVTLEHERFGPLVWLFRLPE